MITVEFFKGVFADFPWLWILGLLALTQAGRVWGWLSWLYDEMIKQGSPR